MGRPLILLLVGALALTAAGGAALDRRSFEDELANLRSPNTRTRMRAAQALGRSGRQEAIAALSDAVEDPEPRVRLAVVKALRQFKNTAAIGALLEGLSDSVAGIRSESLAGLLEIYVDVEKRSPIDHFLGFFDDKEPPEIVPFTEVDEKVVAGLEARLHDSEVSLRRKAALALGLLKAEDGVDSLGAALADPEKPVREEAVEALGRIGGQTAGQALLTALADPSAAIRGKAVEALGRMGHLPGANALLELYQAEPGKKLAEKSLAALAQMGAPEARSLFLEMMTSSDRKRRRWAVEGLARLRDERLARSLTKDFLREPDPSVQLAYCFALARVGRVEFVDRLALALAEPKSGEQARRYLIELGRPLLPEFYLYLADPVPKVREGMARVLMQIGDPASIPYLEPLLSDANPDVADRANRAIARLRRVRVAAAKSPGS